MRRRSADMYATQALRGQTPAFGAPKKVSRDLVGDLPWRLDAARARKEQGELADVPDG